MTPETFLDQFETFAAAPGGVVKLREMILQLAVQGKLVPQDPNDEPAGVLHKQIQESRQLYWEQTELAKMEVKGTCPVSDDWKQRFKDIALLPDECTSKSPTTWKWVRIKEIGEVQLGRQRAPKFQTGPNIRPYLRVQNVYEDRIDVSDLNYMNFSPLEFVSFHLRDGDILLNEGQSFKLVGRPAIYRNEVPGACFQNTLIRLRLYAPLQPDFALLVFRGYMHFGKFQSVAQQTTNIAHLSAGRFAELEFPLPPLAEQRRIVGRVDQLLGLCDELAGRQESRRVTRQKLVGATLDRLTSPPPGESLTPHVDRLHTHFDHLFDTPTTLPKLRQTILQLAVQGKLVPQDPGDEPVEELYARIQIERGGTTIVAESDNDSVPLEAPKSEPLATPPSSWKVVSFVDILVYGPRNGTSPKPVDRITKTKSLTLSATTSGRFDRKHVKYLEEVVPPDSYLWLREGDILIQRSNSEQYVGAAAVYNGEPNEFVYPDLMMKVRVAPSIDIEFAHLVLKSPPTRTYFRTQATGTSGSMRKINKSTVQQLAFPLPPLAEQKRIVAKVTELLSLCDALEAQLTQAHTASTQLLSATLSQLLGGS